MERIHPSLTGDREEPDFVNCDGQKKLIEVNSCYFHACEKCGYGNITLGEETADEIRKHDKIKIENYKAFGYSTLVIWEHELENPEDVTMKLREFNVGKH